jgi:hypothetical protein
MYYDGSNYVRLGYGTSGHFLKTQGSSANPVWAAAPNNNNYLTGLALSSGTLTATVTGAASPTVDLSGLYTAGTGLSRSSQTLSVDASQTQITSVGALNAGSITSGFGTINNGSSTITTTGALGCGAITSTGSFLVTTTDPKQMIFKYDTSNYMDIAVSSAGATTFRTVGAGSEVSHFTLNIDGDIILDAADDIHFQHDGADQLIWDMSSVGGEQKCRVGVNNDDILFAAYNGDEVIRVDTSAKRLTFFNSSGDEAIYGDGAALYLLSNGFPMKLPTAAPGGAGYSLTAATDGTCSWSNISGGGGGSSDITISGTPANNQIAIWTDANTQEGDSDLTFDGSEFLLNTTSTAGNHEVMEVRYTGTATGFGPVLKIFKMKDAADGDLGGRLEFAYKNDGGIQEGGATATLVIEESLNGDENTYLRFAAQIGGATRDIIDIGCPSTGEEYRALSPSSDNLCNLGFTSNAWINTYSREYAHYTGSQWLNGAGDGSELFLWTGEVQANPGSWQLQIASTTGGLTSFGYQPLPPSQLKYKENITDFTLGVDFLESLSPIHFDLKDSVEEALDMQPLKNQLGFTVEAFEAVPALVGYVQTHSVEDDKTVGYIPPKEEFKTIDYLKLHKDMNYALINAVKELSIKNDALEARLAILEAA